MKVLLQRVAQARVDVSGETVGAIQQGLLLLVGIERHDTPERVTRMVDKVLAYRVFADAAGKMNLSVRDIGGGVLAVSQFTLAADTQKGLRPGFSLAAAPDQAAELFDLLLRTLRERHQPVASGVFAADMQVHLVNDGPVTFMLDM
ncbi:MAG: D-aminoacyl-tRNA deacylase [Cellvibrionaceae bacterium]|nr:D-aminoacyl-tRNA deacylase [Cellvibrionaceae bacterium]